MGFTRESFSKYIFQKIKLFDGLILSIGICAFLVGVLVDIFTIRLICLFVVIISASLVYLSMQGKNKEIQQGMKNASSLFQPQFENEGMKKIIFDDFQPQPGGKYIMEEETEPVHENVIESHRPKSKENIEEKNIQPLTPIKLEEKPAAKEFQISDFFDVDSGIFKGEAEPRTEFDFLLNKVLLAIKEVLFAHSVAFFWANREKQQMILETRITDSQNFMPTRRFPIGQDLISKVAETGKPALVTSVNPVSEHELLIYYNNPEIVRSFAAVPVYFSTQITDSYTDLPVGVLIVDSKVEDSFGDESLILMGKFTKLISAMIKNYTDKYDLLVNSELLRSIRILKTRINSDFAQHTVIQTVAEEVSKLINLDFLSVVIYDEKKKSWISRKIINRSHTGYLLTDQAIDFPESLVGQTIKDNKNNLIDDLESVQIPRYFTGEKIESKGSFASVPLSSYNKCYGALSIESQQKSNFSKQGLQILSSLAEQAAYALEILYMNDLIREYVIIDEVTGVYSKKFFLQKMSEELQRSDDNGAELTLLFITLDKSSEITERFGKDGFERIMVTLSKIIRSSVRSYDIVGRYDNSRFGVLLVSSAANEAYLWAEKIRKNVASHVISFDGKSFSITISIGLCGALEGMKREELLGNTTAVLNNATEAGGNTVRVF